MLKASIQAYLPPVTKVISVSVPCQVLNDSNKNQVPIDYDDDPVFP